MKKLLSFSLLLVGLSAEANLCNNPNPYVQTWRSQKNWQEIKVLSSGDNNTFVYDAVVTEKDEVMLKPFEINSSYKSEMKVEINDHYSKERFIKICKSDYRKGRKLSQARFKGSSNSFRLPVQFFPTKANHVGLSLEKQEFEISDIGVRLVFRKDSMVDENKPFLSSLTDLKKDLEDTINQRLEVAKSKVLESGQIEVDLDGMDDLACDVLKGRAEIELYAFSKMKEPEVKVVEEVDVDSLDSLYRGIKSLDGVMKSTEETIFNAGRVYENMSLLGQVQLPHKVSAFNVTQDMFETDFLSLKKLGDSDLVCLAENHSTFEQNQVENSMILNVKSQQIYEMGGE